MNPAAVVTFGELAEPDARALLERRHVGRIAYSLHDRVEIEPISYMCDGDWILMRTSEGSKTEKLRHHPWVAFQVDEVRSPTDWDSVVVHGSIQTLANDGTAVERAAYAQALTALRNIDPNALTGSDPAPHRDRVLRLHIDDFTGRCARSIPE